MTERCSLCKQPLKRRAKKSPVRTKEIRALVAERAGNICECGCGRTLSLYHPQMDHWLGGSGRRKQKQSVETCWMLTMWCHRQRTNNYPSAIYWNRKFRAHCHRYGYVFTPHIEKRQLTRVA